MNDQAPPEALFLDAIALPAARGRYERKASATTMTFVRELTPEDLPALLAASPKAGTIYGKTGLQKLRHTHHYTAMLLAQGAARQQVSVLTGYSPGTISSLLADPMFQQLVSHYREQTAEEVADFGRRAAALGLSFLDELQERLEAEPESFKHKELLAGAEMLLDRTILPSKAQGQAPPPPGPMNLTIQFVEPQAPPAHMTIDAVVRNKKLEG